MHITMLAALIGLSFLQRIKPFAEHVGVWKLSVTENMRHIES